MEADDETAWYPKDHTDHTDEGLEELLRRTSCLANNGVGCDAPDEATGSEANSAVPAAPIELM